MKTRIVLVLFALIASAMFSAAQTETALAPVPEDIEGLMIQVASGGTAEELEDGGYLVTFNGVAATSPVVFTSALTGASYSTQETLQDWEYRSDTFTPETAMATGVLQIGTQNIPVMFMPVVDEDIETSAYDPDAGTLSYMMTINTEAIEAVVMDFDPKDYEIPAEFENAVLFIVLDFAFVDALNNGRYARITEGRLSGAQTCFPGMPGC